MNFFRLPFKRSPPIGYILVWFFDAISICCVIFVIVPVLALGIGLCWLIIAFIKDILNELARLNSFCQAARKNVWELKMRFCTIIQLYSETKELSENYLRVPGKYCCFHKIKSIVLSDSSANSTEFSNF